MVTYAIGNSLTQDLFLNTPGKGFDKITQGLANPTTTGLHLNSSQALERIWRFPDETTDFTASFGKYRDALAGSVDNVFLQPHYGSLISQEIQAVKNFIDYTKLNPANSDTRFFLYAPWGAQIHPGSTTPFYDLWHSDIATLSEFYFPSSKTFDLMMSDLSQSGYEVSLVPVGHSFISIIDAIRSGTTIEMIRKEGANFTTYSLTEAALWRDAIHASSTGAFVAGLTAYSALYGTEPVGFDPIDYANVNAFSADYLSPSGARLVEQIVWNSYVSAIPEPNVLFMTCVELSFLYVSRRKHV
jgi:hypothetical protein